MIQLISAMCPNEVSLLLPLNELLYGLYDLDRGKVVALLGPTKVSHSPGIATSDELFRAMAAAAMTCLVERTAMTRAQAAKDVARRLSRMGYKHPSGKEIKPAQIVGAIPADPGKPLEHRPQERGEVVLAHLPGRHGELEPPT